MSTNEPIASATPGWRSALGRHVASVLCFLVAVFWGVYAAVTLPATDNLKAVGIGLGITIVGLLFDILLMVHGHDSDASDHYQAARKRYQALEKLESRVLVRLLNDVHALVSTIDADIRNLVMPKDLEDQGLFLSLIRLDLNDLRDRLNDIANNEQIPIDTHQQRSHTIVCEVMQREGLREFRAIYDCRSGALKCHKFDIWFAEALDRLAQAGDVAVVGIVLLPHGHADPADVHGLLGDLERFWRSDSYALRTVTGETYERICGQAGLAELASNADIGLYGERYLYQGRGTTSVGTPTGVFKRNPLEVQKHLTVFNDCHSAGVDASA